MSRQKQTKRPLRETKALKKRRLRQRRRLRGGNTSALQSRAQKRLSAFRQGSQLAIALTALLLLFTDSTEAEAPATPETGDLLKTEEVAQATETLGELFYSFYEFIPKLLIVIGLVLVLAFVGKLINSLLKRFFSRSQKGQGIMALTKIAFFFIILVTALSILFGDARALLGSLGLVGLALSWALQAPIESFTGWVLNAFRGYYYTGDRIEVGDVFGDVYKIDILTTTLWEAGGPGKPVSAAQPTGALVTFPNSEVLRSNIINYTRDFPYTWDEVSFGLANETDVAYSLALVRKTAEDILGESMRGAAGQYRKLLHKQGLPYDIEDVPQVYLSMTDSWLNFTVRYLVEARSRRKWSSLLIEKMNIEMARPEHAGRLIGSYPMQRVQLNAGAPATPSPSV